ncbi:4-hydroxy-tetrahydrodipicolinate reductase [Poriferisphaera corsica]|uniref:4-hydroxy-tetrahydrodipicolinate reductase n=1 Tax=Poriferisphaera corsica TaxID=2528020 RepID=A0A517YQB1_9BACT|nr:4-hydroxy-tetrahydrodipicolinate reductase [Poriferisphaera corsica]QDU32407.1 4-hydroxy-tetrahydrodipicolinate reductase [Poriferisphaera corsica]
MTKVAIFGANGRMGRRLVALATEMEGLSVVAGVDGAGSPQIGEDIGVLAGVGELGVPLTDQLCGDVEVDVVIDFSVPAALAGVIEECCKRKLPLVIGTTGIGDEHQAMIDEAGQRIPIIWASNFSLVVNVLNVLAGKAAQLLGSDFDIEIMEAHHRFKKDAPSGTAITLAKHICDASDHDFDRDVVFERHGDDCLRQPNEITIQTLRVGDHPGEHTAYFATLGERLEIKHVSTSRDSYVIGALKAAKWLSLQSAGRYTMSDVLKLDRV